MRTLITVLINLLILNSNAGFPPPTVKSQNDTVKQTTFNLETPNFQATSLNGTTKLIETGNDNELINAGFEHSTVTTGWTVSNATSSANTTTELQGVKALSLALTGALSLSQSSTINAAQKANVQMVASIWVNSSDVSDLQLCSLKNGSEDKCTATGGYVQGSGWRQLTVSFLGNTISNGLKLKSTDTTGTVLVDQTYVGVGSPIVDFTNSTDWEEFTPTFSGIGTPTSVKAFWRRSGDTLEVYGRATSGTVIASGFTINFSSLGVLIDTSKVVSDASKGQIAGTFARDSVDGAMFNIGFNSSSTNFVYVADGGSLGGLRDSDASAIINSTEKFTFKFAVPIVGWAGKSSKAYVASSSDYGWTNYTPTGSWNTNTTYSGRHRRQGDTIEVQVNVELTGAPNAVDLTFTSAQILNGLGITVNTSKLAGNGGTQDLTTVGVGSYSDQGTANRGGLTATWDKAAALLKLPGSSFSDPNATSPITWANGDNLSFTARLPITEWENANVIVGSFEGIEKCATANECNDTFSAKISSGGVVSDENTDWINGNCTWSPAGVATCTFASNIFTVTPNCFPVNASGDTASTVIQSTSSTQVVIRSAQANTGTLTSWTTNILCQKQGADYFPKTAKVAVSTGVNRTEGVERPEIFSVSYGTTNATTVCSASPCSYLDQIGNAVTSITRSSTGQYTLNTAKTYSKLKCVASTGDMGASPRISSSARCESCNSVVFNTVNNAFSFADSYGTLYCHGY